MRFNLSLALFITVIAVSCKKDSAGDKQPYIASPKRLIDLTGSSWSSNKSQFSNKKNYWYTEFTKNQNLAIKAAVSLSAIEETSPYINYYMLMNVARGTEKISAVSISTIDSLNNLTKKEAYDLMLFYYNAGLKPLTDTSLTLGTYTLPDGTQKTTTSKEVVEKLEDGFESSILSINYISGHGNISIVLFKKETTPYYNFSFNGFKN